MQFRMTEFYGKGEICCVLLLSHSVMSKMLFATSWSVAHQAPLSMRILQARILEWVAIPSSRGSSKPRNRTHVSLIAGRLFTVWATRGCFSDLNIFNLLRVYQDKMSS